MLQNKQNTAEQQNLTYDLAEGHNITLKGSMLNESDFPDDEEESIDDYLDDYLLTLVQ